MTYTIKSTDLISAGMPPWDVRKFRSEWPDGAVINVDNLRRARKIGLEPSVLLHSILTDEELDEWRKARCWSVSDTPAGKRIVQLEAEIKTLRGVADQQIRDENDANDVLYLIKGFSHD